MIGVVANASLRAALSVSPDATQESGHAIRRSGRQLQKEPSLDPGRRQDRSVAPQHARRRERDIAEAVQRVFVPLATLDFDDAVVRERSTVIHANDNRPVISEISNPNIGW